ncbi:MAG: hypothetical protein SF070_02320 [Gemmatimonadota bacterium]|nr:hypothetical protein [Gemmatimonadota bacterium]
MPLEASCPSPAATSATCSGPAPPRRRSCLAALAVLADVPERERQRRLNTPGRKAAERFCAACGWRSHVAHANYLFLDVGRDVTGLRAACQERGLLIGRPYPPAETWARITIGTPEEMRRGLAILARVLG